MSRDTIVGIIIIIAFVAISVRWRLNEDARARQEVREHWEKSRREHEKFQVDLKRFIDNSRQEVSEARAH